MRLAALALILVLAAPVAVAQAPDPDLALPPSADNPFVASRGTGPAPPSTLSARTGAAPPEGQGPGGIDFGRWRNANAATYNQAFEDQMAARYASMSRDQARADLERNGFGCRDRGAALECRIEITDSGCNKDWYVALDPQRPRPYAGFDVICARAP
ncbi:MAG: hypothetical protein AB7J28_07180 [Hyphomonadaceae bacterium]